MKFLDNCYDFFAKKFPKIMAFVGFGCYLAAHFFVFWGNVTDPNTANNFFNYLLVFAFDAVIIVGLFFGYYVKKDRRLLIVSFVAVLTMILYQGIIEYSNIAAINALNNDNKGPAVAFWIFRLIFSLVVAGYIVFIILIHLFGLKKLEKISHYIFLGIFPFGFIYWICGIVYAANYQWWDMGLVPLLEVASYVFIPVVLDVIVKVEEKNEEAVAALENERAPEAPKAEEPAPEVEEPKEEKPAPKKAPAKKAAPKKEVVEPEVQEEPKE